MNGRVSIFIRPMVALRDVPSFLVMSTSSLEVNSLRYFVVPSAMNVYASTLPALTRNGRVGTYLDEIVSP